MVEAFSAMYAHMQHLNYFLLQKPSVILNIGYSDLALKLSLPYLQVQCKFVSVIQMVDHSVLIFQLYLSMD